MQTTSIDQLAGSVLGDYQVERLLGNGHYGTAYLARQRSQGRQVVITTFNMREEMVAWQRDHLADRIAQERVLLTRLAHPNILPTYDFGAYANQLYLVTAVFNGISLSQALKQQKRLTPQQTLDVLKQMASCLDYAHSSGVVHGLLSPSQVQIGARLQIAGFGLRTILEVRQPQAQHFPLNATGAIQDNLEYSAPECVQGGPIDARSDIYALGVMLFELLSGSLPFSGQTPFESTLQRMHQSAHSVHSLCPDVPEALDLVIDKMLERDPVKRYKRASEGAVAFERVLQSFEAMERASTARSSRLVLESQQMLPPPVNEGKQAKPISRSFSLAGIDPFAWWTSMTTKDPQVAPGSFARGSQRQPVRLSDKRGRRRPIRQDRRQVVKMVATSATIVGVFAIGGISFEHFVQSLKQPQQSATGSILPGSTTTTQGNTPAAGTTPSTQKSPSASKTATPKASPTHSTQPSPTGQPTTQPTGQPTPQPTTPPTPQPTPQPTQPPTPTPSPTPSHTGTVIGQTSQPANSAVKFTNPADGNAGLLIHLGNGNFVACERACTHAG
ncbi:MAG TPA: serine/threonine-protein kinase, partial [Ktedonobacteraceae bacterium]|nr:serine/threonine-protein kinase [Ktedonobacteraceae bacterium]